MTHPTTGAISVVYSSISNSWRFQITNRPDTPLGVARAPPFPLIMSRQRKRYQVMCICIGCSWDLVCGAEFGVFSIRKSMCWSNNSKHITSYSYSSSYSYVSSLLPFIRLIFIDNINDIENITYYLITRVVYVFFFFCHLTLVLCDTDEPQ